MITIINNIKFKIKYLFHKFETPLDYYLTKNNIKLKNELYMNIIHFLKNSKIKQKWKNIEFNYDENNNQMIIKLNNYQSLKWTDTNCININENEIYVIKSNDGIKFDIYYNTEYNLDELINLFFKY